MNDQVKAGLAALKDFLGGHTETADEDAPPMIGGDPMSTGEGALNNPESDAEKKTVTSPQPDAPAHPGEATFPHRSPEHNETEKPLDAAAETETHSAHKSERNNHKAGSEEKGNLKTDEDQQNQHQVESAQTTSSATPGNNNELKAEVPTKDRATADKEETAKGSMEGQLSIDQASFEDAVETLRAAGPSAGRVAAARTIASLGSQRGTPHLIAAMFDDDAEVRSAAEEALARMGEPTFQQHTTEIETEKSKMMQPPSSAQHETSVSPPTKDVAPPTVTDTAHAQKKPGTQSSEKQQTKAEGVVHTGSSQPAARVVTSIPNGEAACTEKPAQEPTSPKAHKLKAVASKTEVALDPESTEEEQQLLLEERAVRQRLELVLQQLTEKAAARKELENEAHWRLERESKLLTEAAAQRAKEEKARRKAEEEAAQRRKQEAQAIEAEQTARAKADAEAERLATAEVRLRNEIAKLNRSAEELEQRRKDAENARLAAAATARQTEAQRARDEADRLHKGELERLRSEQAVLQAATEKAAARRAEVDAARERAEKDAEALAVAQTRMRAAEDARIKAEAERVKLEAELNLKVENEEALLAAAKQRAQDEQARLEEEARRHRDSEEKRLADLEDTKRRAELEARQRAEREQQIRGQLDTLRIADAEVRKRTEEAEVRRRAAEEAFRLVAEKVQRVEAEAHASKLEEEQILAKLEAARRNAAVEAQGRAEQEKRIKEEIEMFRRLEDEERPRLEELILQRSQAETRLHQERERFKAEEEARVRAEEQIESLREYHRPVVDVHEPANDTVHIPTPIAPAPVSAAPTHFAGVARVTSTESAADEAEIPASPAIPAAISSYLHSVDPYKRAAAVAELARSHTKDAFELIARSFDDPSPHVRNAAARALRRLEPQKSVDLFNRALEEGSTERRKNIGNAIAASGLASEAIDNLVSENREETYHALSILFVMAKTGEVQPLIQAIEEHENEEVCRAVLKLLTLSGQSELGDAALQRRVMGVAVNREKAAATHDEIPDFRLRIAEVEVKRALNSHQKSEE